MTRRVGIYDPAPLLAQLRLTVPARPATFDRYSGGGCELQLHAFPTIGQMAEAIGVTKRTISRWKNGSLISDRDAERFALRIGLDPCLLWDDWYAT
jgi:hypothetical protein